MSDTKRYLKTLTLSFILGFIEAAYFYWTVPRIITVEWVQTSYWDYWLWLMLFGMMTHQFINRPDYSKEIDPAGKAQEYIIESFMTLTFVFIIIQIALFCMGR